MSLHCHKVTNMLSTSVKVFLAFLLLPATIVASNEMQVSIALSKDSPDVQYFAGEGAKIYKRNLTRSKFVVDEIFDSMVEVMSDGRQYVIYATLRRCSLLDNQACAMKKGRRYYCAINVVTEDIEPIKVKCLKNMDLYFYSRLYLHENQIPIGNYYYFKIWK